MKANWKIIFWANRLANAKNKIENNYKLFNDSNSANYERNHIFLQLKMKYDCQYLDGAHKSISFTNF